MINVARLARRAGDDGGSLLQWAIDREGKAADRLGEDLNAVLNSRNSASRDRRKHPRRRVRRG
jgi:hypothetical protein